jgi:hypothetical protein
MHAKYSRWNKTLLVNLFLDLLHRHMFLDDGPLFAP